MKPRRFDEAHLHDLAGYRAFNCSILSCRIEKIVVN